jgi:hypothetical protein
MKSIIKALKYLRYFCVAFCKGYFVIKKLCPRYSLWKTLKTTFGITRVWASIYWTSTKEEWDFMYGVVREGLDK